MKPGKPLTTSEKEEIYDLYAKGFNQSQISRKIHRSNAAICQALAGVKKTKKVVETDLFDERDYVIA